MREEADGAALVAQSYNMFRFYMAAQGRGRLPVKFNGGLFTQQYRLNDRYIKQDGLEIFKKHYPFAIQQADGSWLTRRGLPGVGTPLHRAKRAIALLAALDERRLRPAAAVLRLLLGCPRNAQGDHLEALRTCRRLLPGERHAHHWHGRLGAAVENQGRREIHGQSSHVPPHQRPGGGGDDGRLRQLYRRHEVLRRAAGALCPGNPALLRSALSAIPTASCVWNPPRHWRPGGSRSTRPPTWRACDFAWTNCLR